MKTPILVFTAFLTLILFSQAAAQQPRSVAVTFDDLPATGGASTLQRLLYINSNLLEKLSEEKVPATGFVNEGKLMVEGEIDARTAILAEWLDRGHLLGNHTYSHIAIDSASFEQYREDLIRGETVTRMLLEKRGLKLKYYRHTQLRTGPDEVYRKQLADLLKERGYTVAPVTIDNNEYIFAAVYNDAVSIGDKGLAGRIAVSYIDYMSDVFEHFEGLSKEFLGYEVPQILLLHANELNADHFEELAEMMKDRGYRFITLEEALKDKAYRLPEAGSGRGLSWIHRWMLAKGEKTREEPDAPAWISELFRNRG